MESQTLMRPGIQVVKPMLPAAAKDLGSRQEQLDSYQTENPSKAFYRPCVEGKNEVAI
jgi:hypothetical protein